MKYEGHFLLWYIIILPFAKLGFPYFSMNIISWIITCISVWLILDKAPFKFYKKVLLIFTLPLLYLYPAISRCYCLIPLAIVLMAMFYKDRKEKPFRYLISVVILANTHVIMLGMVGAVLLEFLFEIYKDSKNEERVEIKKRVKSIIITVILLILSMLPLLGCLTTNSDVSVNTSNILNKIINCFFYYPILLILYNFGFLNSISSMVVLILIISSIILVLNLKNNTDTYIKILICILWQCIIYAFIYHISDQKAAAIIFILLYYKWIENYKESTNWGKIEKKIISIGYVILIALNIISGIKYIKEIDIESKYSNAYQMGDYINRSIDEDSIILNGVRAEFNSSIIPYINKNIKFYQIKGNRYFSYVKWDNINNEKLYFEDIDNLRNIFDKKRKLYYVFCTYMLDNQKDNVKMHEKKLIEECINKGVFKKIYATDEKSINNEEYILYEVDLTCFLQS